jgi:hypothetical protein
LYQGTTLETAEKSSERKGTGLPVPQGIAKESGLSRWGTVFLTALHEKPYLSA